MLYPRVYLLAIMEQYEATHPRCIVTAGGVKACRASQACDGSRGRGDTGPGADGQAGVWSHGPHNIHYRLYVDNMSRRTALCGGGVSV